jgi:glucose/arabinose dehydrogenase
MGPAAPPEGQAGLSLDELPPGAASTIVEGLEVPWEFAFLPDGGLLVTERPGRLIRLPPPGGAPALPLRPDDGAVWEIPGVRAQGEGGLMGLALHPRFADNGWFYVMLTAATPGGTAIENRVERYRLAGEGPVDRRVIVSGMPGASFHDGGRIAFGPDGYLYITAGDAGESVRARDPGSLGGKVLRVGDEGDVPPGAPFGSAVWSYGHRNPQGLAWDSDGRLWATEHGRSGLRSGLDEVNVIRPGGNYGWPGVEGDGEEGGMTGPVLHSGPRYTWAPAGIAWVDGRLYFGGLRGEALYEATTAGGEIEGLMAHFAMELGRIRVVVPGPDGALYLATSNRDGRGRPRNGDDRIVRLSLEALRR